MINIKLKSDEKLFLLTLVGYVLMWVPVYFTFSSLPGPLRGLIAVLLLVWTLGMICWFLYLVIIAFIDWYKFAELHQEGWLGKVISWVKTDDR